MQYFESLVSIVTQFRERERGRTGEERRREGKKDARKEGREQSF